MSGAAPAARVEEGARAVRIRIPWTQLDQRLVDLVHRLRGRGEQERELAAALHATAATLRAGSPLHAALAAGARGSSGPVSASLEHATARLRLGQDASLVLDRLAADLELPVAAALARSLAVRLERGGDLAGPCRQLATVLAERARLRGEARAMTASARASARAVLALPAGMLALALVVAPEAVARTAAPPTGLLALPALLLMAAGVLVVRRIGSRAGDLDAVERSREHGPVGRMAGSIAGTGPASLRSTRLALAVAPIGLGAALAAGWFGVVSGTGLVACALAWPWSADAAERRARADAVTHGIEALLEASIALLAAGATPGEVALAAVEAAPAPLREQLHPAALQVQLGRDPASAFAAARIVRESPLLQGWAAALAAAGSHGAPATSVVDQLLRDARAASVERVRSRAAAAGPRIQLATVLLIVPAITWLVLLATAAGAASQLAAAGLG